jgi:pimeloyl-ACP methyl ester carboxylesterase
VGFKSKIRMKIYAISGLGADERIFEYLSLEHELVPISWIKPKSKESIIDYAERLIDKYDLRNENDFGVLGVSFGGLIATEISKLVSPNFTILISSAETRNDLNGVIKLAGKSKLIELIPERLFNPPKAIAHFLFGTDKKVLLNSILDDTDLNFAKWATRELVNWQNQTSLLNLIKIGGSNDKLLAPKGKNTIIIENGEHFMIVDRADEISEIINEKIKTYNTNK